MLKDITALTDKQLDAFTLGLAKYRNRKRKYQAILDDQEFVASLQEFTAKDLRNFATQRVVDHYRKHSSTEFELLGNFVFADIDTYDHFEQEHARSLYIKQTIDNTPPESTKGEPVIKIKRGRPAKAKKSCDAESLIRTEDEPVPYQARRKIIKLKLNSVGQDTNNEGIRITVKEKKQGTISLPQSLLSSPFPDYELPSSFSNSSEEESVTFLQDITAVSDQVPQWAVQQSIASLEKNFQQQIVSAPDTQPIDLESKAQQAPVNLPSLSKAFGPLLPEDSRETTVEDKQVKHSSMVEVQQLSSNNGHCQTMHQEMSQLVDASNRALDKQTRTDSHTLDYKQLSRAQLIQKVEDYRQQAEYYRFMLKVWQESSDLK